MPSFRVVSGALRALCVSVLVFSAALAAPAQAQSKRERDLEAIRMRMAAAEGRYREALVKVGNNDPAGVGESNVALEDMEDVIADCLKLKGCPMSQLLATYKRLLKADVDARAAGDTT